jgi:DNA mismatch endonuclease (patch repair protein)
MKGLRCVTPVSTTMADYKTDRIAVPRFDEANGFYTTSARSQLMAKIRATNTKPEIALRKALWAFNIRYRINDKSLPGKPDVAIKKYRLAIFIDGEFWHGHNWEDKRAKIKTNTAYWIPKIERNMQRDAQATHELEAAGYTVFRFWEKQVKKDLEGCVAEITDYLKNTKKKLIYR